MLTPLEVEVPAARTSQATEQIQSTALGRPVTFVNFFYDAEAQTAYIDVRNF